MTSQIENTLTSINMKALMQTRGLKLELVESKVFSATLRNKDNKIVDRLDIPCSNDNEIKMLLTGYQLALAQN